MPELSEAQHAVLDLVRGLVQREISPIARDIEGSGEFPAAARRAFASERLFTLAMPKSHGGRDADALSLALMVETISRVSPSAALLVFPTNAVLRTIALTGTPEQKDRLFAELATGDQMMGFCLTEPDHGSDAAGLTTAAVLEGDDYVVTGSKAYITLGPHARYYMTFVTTSPGKGAGGISALLIPHDAPGLTFGPAEKKMGLHGSVTTMMYLDGARVPAANRLGAEGEGWRVLTRVANPMRVWGAASMALGIAQGLLDLALDFARREKREGRPIMHHQAAAFALADMAMQIEACRSLNRRACRLVDDAAADAIQVESLVSTAKCFAADTAVKVAELAGDVMGAAMVVGDSLAGRLFCAAKGIQIFDGSNQVQRLIVARNLARS